MGTTQKKYSEYIYNYDGRDGFSFSAGVPFEIVTRVHSNIIAGSNFYFVQWVLPHPEPFLRFGHPPHIHKNAELLFHIGSDPESPQDLGAEVEMYMGPETGEARHHSDLRRLHPAQLRALPAPVHQELAALDLHHGRTRGPCIPRRATTSCCREISWSRRKSISAGSWTKDSRRPLERGALGRRNALDVAQMV